MSTRDPLDAWKDEIRRRMVPDGFTDHVLDALPTEPRLTERLWRRPLVRAATWLLAGCVLAARIVAALAFFILG